MNDKRGLMRKANNSGPGFIFFRKFRYPLISKAINMKSLLLLALAVWSTHVFGQTPAPQAKESLKVVYTDNEHNTQKPAYFLNGKLISGTVLETFNPALINSVDVVKEKIKIDGIEYFGQIHITTKSDYQPSLISLTALKDKYTNLKDKPTVFMLDGRIINGDYDKYLVDENYLLTLVVDKFENKKDNISLSLIKLLTKSPENIKKSKEIRIRGSEVAMNK